MRSKLRLLYCWPTELWTHFRKELTTFFGSVPQSLSKQPSQPLNKFNTVRAEQANACWRCLVADLGEQFLFSRLCPLLGTLERWMHECPMHVILHVPGCAMRLCVRSLSQDPQINRRRWSYLW